MNIKNRLVNYDLMRVIACFLVITIHCGVCDQFRSYSTSTLGGLAPNIWGTLARWAVPAFIMLSGMMFLRSDKEISLKDLYKKKVLRMFTAFFFWSIVYSAYNVYVLGDNHAGSPFKSFFDGCFSGETHMWYVLVAAGLYIISPILKVLLQKLSKKMLTYWIVIMFIFGSCVPFISDMNQIKIISPIVETVGGYMDLQFLCGWTLYFVLGYLIQNHEFTHKQRMITYILAGVSFLFTVFGTVIYTYLTGASLGVLPYEYPNIVLMSVGILLFFKENIGRIKFKERTKKVIVWLSSLTFGIYLSHILILKVLYRFGINISICNPILSIFIVSAVTFIVGAILTWILRKIPVINNYIA